jgi:NADH-quinone oxidoreductase subunit J
VSIGVIPFAILSAVAVLAALAMVISRNAVHAALFLLINFSALSVLYLSLDAPLAALVQALVYIGGIMILILLTILLLDAHKLQTRSKLEWQIPAAISLSLVLLVVGGYVASKGIEIGIESEPGLAPTLGDSGPQAIGQLLFDSYLLPLEIISVLLLIAIIGVVNLTINKENHK